jgi:putative membrane protein
VIGDGEPSWTPEAPPGFLTFVEITPLPAPVLPVIAGSLALAYAVGVVRVRTTGRRWSAGRSVSFLAGCLLLAATTGLALEAYGTRLFSVFMFQQLTLMILVPPFLVLGAPGLLLLRAVPHRGVGRVTLRAVHGVLRSRAARIALHPALGLGLFILAFYGLYFSGLADVLLGSVAGHVALEVGFLVFGILFAIPVLSPDPLPIRFRHAGRILDVFAEMALHAFFGVILMVSVVPVVSAFATPPPGWDVDPLADQQLAGGLAWSYGEAPTVLILVYLVHRWYTDDTRRAARADRRSDETGNTDIAEYNHFLEQLESRRPGR